jgi:hypothetical protein
MHVHDHPSSITLLNMFYGEQRRFFSSESAADHHRQERTIAFPFEGGCVGSVDKRLCLTDSQPVARADTFSLDALHSPDAGSEFRLHQPVVGGFYSKSPDRGHVQIHRGRRHA